MMWLFCTSRDFICSMRFRYLRIQGPVHIIKHRRPMCEKRERLCFLGCHTDQILVNSKYWIQITWHVKMTMSTIWLKLYFFFSQSHIHWPPETHVVVLVLVFFLLAPSCSHLEGLPSPPPLCLCHSSFKQSPTLTRSTDSSRYSSNGFHFLSSKETRAEGLLWKAEDRNLS